jgi:hypothetical protein
MQFNELYTVYFRNTAQMTNKNISTKNKIVIAMKWQWKLFLNFSF